MKLADEICDALMNQVIESTCILIPSFFYHGWEMDLCKIRKNGMVIEYEIKISRHDFKNDFKKTGVDPTTYTTQNKHELILSGLTDINRFYFVTTPGLIQPDEIPYYAGLMEYNRYKGFTTIKAAPLIHKRSVPESRFFGLAKSLSSRASGYRRSLRQLQAQSKSVKKLK